MRPKVAQFCGVYHNVFWVVVSRAGDGDCTQQTLLVYAAKYGAPFTLMHCWDEFKDYPKWKQVELPNFEANTQEKNKRYKSSISSSFNTTLRVLI